MNKIIMISRDVGILDKESPVYSRVLEYSNFFDEIHVVVMSGKTRVSDFSNTSRLFIYNKTSKSKLFSAVKTFHGAIKIAKMIGPKDNWVTSQDPFESGMISYIVAKFSGLNLQIQLHTDCFNVSFIKHSISNYLKALVARFIVTKAQSVRVVSERIKSSILLLKPNIEPLIHVLPIWVDVEVIKKEEIRDESNLRIKFQEFNKIILIVARLESEKNIELALYAFKKVLRFNDSVGLIIAGTGRKERWLKRLVYHLDIVDKVRFIGWTKYTSSLYKTSDVLLVTSLYEGYGMSIVEAVACGCPVISTDVGIAKDIGAIIVPFDAGQISLELVKALDSVQRPILENKFIIAKDDYLNRFKSLFA